MISIIMPSLNPDIRKLFTTLNCILQNDGKYEVILVLQKTNIKKVNKIKNYFSFNVKLKIINDTGIGISRARNIAIKASDGDWILLLDDDVYIENNTIQNLNKQLSSDEMFYYGNALIHCTNSYYVRYYVINRNLSIWSYNRVCSISLIVNRKTFDKIGWFDESLGSGCEFGSSEESDFIIRALLNKIKIGYLKDYSVYHEKAEHSLQKVESYSMGAGALCRKHLASKNLKLYTKFLLDLTLRIFFLLSFKRKRYIFFKGFLKGFVKYNNYK
jgi:glycosyltransferase involved in cell wall biosynthesis